DESLKLTAAAAAAELRRGGRAPTFRASSCGWPLLSSLRGQDLTRVMPPARWLGSCANLELANSTPKLTLRMHRDCSRSPELSALPALAVWRGGGWSQPDLSRANLHCILEIRTQGRCQSRRQWLRAVGFTLGQQLSRTIDGEAERLGRGGAGGGGHGADRQRQSPPPPPPQTRQLDAGSGCSCVAKRERTGKKQFICHMLILLLLESGPAALVEKSLPLGNSCLSPAVIGDGIAAKFPFPFATDTGCMDRPDPTAPRNFKPSISTLIRYGDFAGHSKQELTARSGSDLMELPRLASRVGRSAAKSLPAPLLTADSLNCRISGAFDLSHCVGWQTAQADGVQSLLLLLRVPAEPVQRPQPAPVAIGRLFGFFNCRRRCHRARLLVDGLEGALLGEAALQAGESCLALLQADGHPRASRVLPITVPLDSAHTCTLSRFFGRRCRALSDRLPRDRRRLPSLCRKTATAAAQAPSTSRKMSASDTVQRGGEYLAGAAVGAVVHVDHVSASDLTSLVTGLHPGGASGPSTDGTSAFVLTGVRTGQVCLGRHVLSSDSGAEIPDAEDQRLRPAAEEARRLLKHRDGGPVDHFRSEVVHAVPAGRAAEMPDAAEAEAASRRPTRARGRSAALAEAAAATGVTRRIPGLARPGLEASAGAGKSGTGQRTQAQAWPPLPCLQLLAAQLPGAGTRMLSQRMTAGREWAAAPEQGTKQKECCRNWSRIKEDLGWVASSCWELLARSEPLVMGKAEGKKLNPTGDTEKLGRFSKIRAERQLRQQLEELRLVVTGNMASAAQKQFLHTQEVIDLLNRRPLGPLEYILFAAYGVAMLWSLGANGLFIAMGLRYKQLRQRLPKLMVSLAASNLLVTLVCMPAAVCYLVYHTWPLGKVGCKLMHFTEVSLVECHNKRRSFRRQEPVKQRLWQGRRLVLLLLLVWGGAAALASPNIFIRSTVTFGVQSMQEFMQGRNRGGGGEALNATGSPSDAPEDQQCGEICVTFCDEYWGENPWARRLYSVLLLLLVFCMPCAVISACYCFITASIAALARLLSQSEQQPDGEELQLWRLQRHQQRPPTPQHPAPPSPNLLHPNRCLMLNLSQHQHQRHRQSLQFSSSAPVSPTTGGGGGSDAVGPSSPVGAEGPGGGNVGGLSRFHSHDRLNPCVSSYTDQIQASESHSSVPSQYQASVAHQSTKRAVQTLVLLVACFVICWLPVNLVGVWIDFSSAGGGHQRRDPRPPFRGGLQLVAGRPEVMRPLEESIYSVALFLGHLHSAVSPICYWCLNKSFRRHLSALASRMCCRVFRRSGNRQDEQRRGRGGGAGVGAGGGARGGRGDPCGGGGGGGGGGGRAEGACAVPLVIPDDAPDGRTTAAVAAAVAAGGYIGSRSSDTESARVLAGKLRLIGLSLSAPTARQLGRGWRGRPAFREFQLRVASHSDPLQRVTPDPLQRVTPDPLQRITPDPLQRVTPDPLQRVTPDPLQRVTPDPLQRVTPDPLQRVTPDPLQRVTPDPLQRVTPDSLQRVTPIHSRDRSEPTIGGVGAAAAAAGEADTGPDSPSRGFSMPTVTEPNRAAASAWSNRLESTVRPRRTSGGSGLSLLTLADGVPTLGDRMPTHTAASGPESLLATTASARRLSISRRPIAWARGSRTSLGRAGAASSRAPMFTGSPPEPPPDSALARARTARATIEEGAPEAGRRGLQEAVA
uniref:G_PROTEIN_RECEP_F1_2 domain-containing protein n=1 Tax=Macrostomum lignano TaxID=282301 RepID=A0A1I8I8T6_9PLAT